MCSLLALQRVWVKTLANVRLFLYLFIYYFRWKREESRTDCRDRIWVKGQVNTPQQSLMDVMGNFFCRSHFIPNNIFKTNNLSLSGDDLLEQKNSCFVLLFPLAFVLVLICTLLCWRDRVTLALMACRRCPVEDTRPRRLFWSHTRPGTTTDKTYLCGLLIWRWASPISLQSTSYSAHEWCMGISGLSLSN